MHRLLATTISVLALAMAMALPAQAESADWNELSVSATAYNSLPRQTTKVKPSIAAWGAKLKPGMRVIAVSRDLIRAGLTNGARVKIEGLTGIYTVRDKMNSRWRKKIDIYMGKDVEAALEWGIQKNIEISWVAPPE